MTYDASSPSVVLEAAAQELVEATAGPPYPFDMKLAEGRKTLDARCKPVSCPTLA